MKYKISLISVTDLNVEYQMFAAISHILWQQFSKPFILCLVLKWTVCVQIQCMLYFVQFKGENNGSGVSSYIWTTINFDSYWWTSTSFSFSFIKIHLLYIFLWMFVLDMYFVWVVYLRWYPHWTPYNAFKY